MKKPSRRRFVAAALASAFAPAAMAIPNNMQEKSILVHHVYFWLKNAGHMADREALMAGLRTLKAIPQIKKLLVGTVASTESRGVVDGSYDVSELMYFASLEDQAAYQAHAIHKAFVEKYSHLWNRVVVYDTWMQEA